MRKKLFVLGSPILDEIQDAVGFWLDHGQASLVRPTMIANKESAIQFIDVSMVV